jgi:hypothetical protein
MRPYRVLALVAGVSALLAVPPAISANGLSVKQARKRTVEYTRKNCKDATCLGWHVGKCKRVSLRRVDCFGDYTVLYGGGSVECSFWTHVVRDSDGSVDLNAPYKLRCRVGIDRAFETLNVRRSGI